MPQPDSVVPAVAPSPTPHGLGRMQKPDPRDRRHMLAAPRRASSRTNRAWWAPGPALDQGTTPQCVGYATAKWLQAGPVTNPGPLDPATIYREAQEVDEWPGSDYDGTSVRGAMKVLQRRGLVEGYDWAFDTDTIVYHLLETGPMILGTWWHWDMFDPTPDGYIRPTGGEAGGHAYLAVGVNVRRRNPDGSLGAVRIQNSWGPWGQRGRAWISFDDMRKLIDEDPYAEAAMGRELKVRL